MYCRFHEKNALNDSKIPIFGHSHLLTELGKTLVPIVNAMSDWGHDYFQYLGVPDPCPED